MFPADIAISSAQQGEGASWRNTLPIHPAAEMFPLLTPSELAALGADIKTNGLINPIVLWLASKDAQAQLLDGRNRLDAIETVIGSADIDGRSIGAGEDFVASDKVIVLDKSVDPYAYVISANFHRRHLTAEQKRELIATVIQADPSKSDRQIAEMVKASPTTVGTVRAEMESNCPDWTVAEASRQGRKEPSATELRPRPDPPRHEARRGHHRRDQGDFAR